jgi:hypothetical protein
MVVMLERRGLISRTPGQARSVRVLVPPDALPNLYGGETPRHQESAFETRYPHIANWIVGGGRVELGRTDYSRSMARALDEGGMVWEGKVHYTGMDELLRDLDEGLAQQGATDG